VYVLDTSEALTPVTDVCYVQADKYGPAWQIARAALRLEAGAQLFTDPECKKHYAPVKDSVVAKIDDIRARNVKLDKKALEAVLANAEASDEEKLAAVKALLGA
jgi:hypothetical protein